MFFEVVDLAAKRAEPFESPKKCVVFKGPCLTDFDLTQILRTWPHEAGRINARRIEGADGRPKLQIRIDLGVLQMEIEGRPDGLRPFDFESLLDYQWDRLRRYAAESQPAEDGNEGLAAGAVGAGKPGRSGFGGATGFVLSQDECRALREEAVQYYHRYVGLFALCDFAGVLRDTTRNLELFDLCRDFGQTEMDRTVLEQFRPPVLMMRARSAAEMAIVSGHPKHALAALDRGLAQLRAFFDDAGRSEEFEGANEVQLLRGMRDALVPKLPSSQKVELQERLRAAIDAENYELAAILRDELRMMED